MYVANAISQLHLLPPFKEGGRIAQDLRVQRIRHFDAWLIGAKAGWLGPFNANQKRVEVQVIEIGRPTADLPQQVGTTDHFVQGFEAKAGEDFAYVFGDEAHQIDDLLRRAGKALTKGFILDADAHGAGVGMALTHHDAAHRDQRRGTDAKLFSP